MRACPACLSVFASEPEFCAFDGERLQEEDALFGRAIGGYRLDGLIGIGGTGCVFRSWKLSSGQPCAIKILYGEMATDRSVAERFRREAEAIRAIDHPNVVKILDAGRSPAGLTYLVMELVEGPTLRSVIDDEAPIDPRRVGRLAEQLVAGLAEAHRQGFVHRDLKPGNIIVLPDRQGRETVKILDFGIVASLQNRDADDRLTKTGYIVGTPTYMPPEQVDPKAVSAQVDVYALGIILYELLAGAPPFTGTLEQVLVAKMTQRPPPLPGAGELGDLVLSLIEPEPSRRPANALRVSAELSRLSLLSAEPATVRADAIDDDWSNGRVPMPSGPTEPYEAIDTKVVHCASLGADLQESGQTVATVFTPVAESPSDSGDTAATYEGPPTFDDAPAFDNTGAEVVEPASLVGRDDGGERPPLTVCAPEGTSIANGRACPAPTSPTAVAVVSQFDPRMPAATRAPSPPALGPNPRPSGSRSSPLRAEFEIQYPRPTGRPPPSSRLGPRASNPVDTKPPLLPLRHPSRVRGSGLRRAAHSPPSAGPTSAGPNSTSAGPNSASAGPNSASAGPNSASAGPSSASAGPNSASAGPNSTSAGRNSTSAGRNSASAGPSSTSTGRNSTSAGRNSASAGLNSTSAGSDWVAPTAIVLLLTLSALLGFLLASRRESALPDRPMMEAPVARPAGSPAP